MSFAGRKRLKLFCWASLTMIGVSLAVGMGRWVGGRPKAAGVNLVTYLSDPWFCEKLSRFRVGDPERMAVKALGEPGRVMYQGDPAYPIEGWFKPDGKSFYKALVYFSSTSDLIAYIFVSRHGYIEDKEVGPS